MGCCASGATEDEASLVRASSSSRGGPILVKERSYGSGNPYLSSHSTSSASARSRSTDNGGTGSRRSSSGTSGGRYETGGDRPTARTTAVSHERPSDKVVKSDASVSPFENLTAFCPDKYWVKDDEAPTCGYCGDDFTLMNRRHHCRLCGDVFHGGDCSQKAGPLEVWVCTFCYTYHTVYKERLQHGTVMTKYTKDLSRNHQRHFWMSSDGREVMWKEVESRSPLGVLGGPDVHNLRLTEVTRVHPTGPPGLEGYGHSHAFQVMTGERPYVLEAANVRDYDTWTEGLKCAVYVAQAFQNLQGRRLEDRARRHAKNSRDSHRQLLADRVRARQAQR